MTAASPAMARLLGDLDLIAASEAPVVVSGESGTGKEVIAWAIHRRGKRAQMPFVPVSCAAFPDTLLEAELFGHERGAFTGAVGRRAGRFEAAHGGTLFLDEIGDLPLAAQVKLLRVLQEGRYEPLGTNRTVDADVRVVSATHRDLRELVREGRFREDLYYRIKVLEVRVPPLRERREDLACLVHHFLEQLGAGEKRLSERAWALLGRHAFPGNVRELRHAIEHAVVLARGQRIEVEHLPVEIAAHPIHRGDEVSDGPPLPLAVAVQAFEREHLLRALAYCGGHRGATAELLGISRKNLWEKMRALRIDGSELGAPPSSRRLRRATPSSRARCLDERVAS